MRSKRLNCPACKATDLEVIFTRDEWNFFAREQNDARKNFSAAMDKNMLLSFNNMMRCVVCGTTFTDFVPDKDSLSDFYQKYYGNDGYLAKINRKVSLNQRRIFVLKTLIKGRRFIDVGCNVGCSVEAARRNGFNATGLEIDSTAIGHAHSLYPENRFIVGTIEAAPSGEVFDLVYCTEVLEHVQDTNYFIESLAKLVAPGGVMFLTSPDSGHRTVRDKLATWDSVKPPEHLTLFTRRGIKTALKPLFKRIFILPNSKPGLQVIAFKS